MTLVAPPAIAIRRIVLAALEEDAGRGDITSAACVPANRTARARIVAREKLVLSGLDIARAVFRELSDAIRFDASTSDGSIVEANQAVAEIEGPAHAVLLGERVALNFLQRMSGVATTTRRFVDAVPTGAKTRIVDTRKTTPGLRALERYAVRCGGGKNHRDDLAAGILIKDNHVAAAGSVTAAVTAARTHAPHSSRIECEVDTLDQLREALDAGADAVLLDNFDDDGVRQAVEIVAGRAIIEASGGITLARVPRLAALGIDVLSIGSLTHSAHAVDLALDWASR